MSSYRPTQRSYGPDTPSNVTYMDNRAPPGDQTGVYYIVLANTKNGVQWQELKDFVRSKGVEVDHVEIYRHGAWIRVNGKENFRKAWDNLNGAIFQNRCLMASHNEKTPLMIPNMHFPIPVPYTPAIGQTRPSSVSSSNAHTLGSPTRSNVTMSSVTTAECPSAPAGYQVGRNVSYPPHLNSWPTSYAQDEYAMGYVPAGYAQGGFAEAGYGTNTICHPEYLVTNTSSYIMGPAPYATHQGVYPPGSYAMDMNAAVESMHQLSLTSGGQSHMTVEAVCRKIIVSRLSHRVWATPGEMHKIVRDQVSAAAEKEIVHAQPNSANASRPPRYSYSVIFRTPEAAIEAVRRLDGLSLKDCKLKAKAAKEGVTDATVPAPAPAPTPEHSSKKSRSSSSKDQEKRDNDKPIIADGSKHRDKKKSKSA